MDISQFPLDLTFFEFLTFGDTRWGLAPLPFAPEYGSRSRRFERKQKMFLPHPRVKVSIVGKPP